MDLGNFSDQHNFLPALKALFKDLKVPMNYVADEPTTAKEILKDTYKENDAFQLMDGVYILGMADYDGILIFEAGDSKRTTHIYWHLDDYYLGETKDVHQFSLNPPVGEHCLKLIDENGISSTVNFEIIGSSKPRK